MRTTLLSLLLSLIAIIARDLYVLVGCKSANVTCLIYPSLVAIKKFTKRGVLVLRELKTKPHRIMAISSYGENHILHLNTSSDRHIKVN